MVTTNPPKPRVFVDADVLFSGVASPSDSGASLVLLRLSEITLIEAVTSVPVVTEVERNLARKVPQAMAAFHMLVRRCLRVVEDPLLGHLAAHAGRADPKDLPILLAARREECAYLVTFNVRHFQPGIDGVSVVRPGELVARVRDWLAYLRSDAE